MHTAIEWLLRVLVQEAILWVFRINTRRRHRRWLSAGARQHRSMQFEAGERIRIPVMVATPDSGSGPYELRWVECGAGRTLGCARVDMLDFVGSESFWRSARHVPGGDACDGASTRDPFEDLELVLVEGTPPFPPNTTARVRLTPADLAIIEAVVRPRASR